MHFPRWRPERPEQGVLRPMGQLVPAPGARRPSHVLWMLPVWIGAVITAQVAIHSAALPAPSASAWEHQHPIPYLDHQPTAADEPERPVTAADRRRAAATELRERLQEKRDLWMAALDAEAAQRDLDQRDRAQAGEDFPGMKPPPDDLVAWEYTPKWESLRSTSSGGTFRYIGRPRIGCIRAGGF